MCRILDARVAEKVMGLGKIVEGPEGWGLCWVNGDEPEPLLAYSTDLNVAFEVVNSFVAETDIVVTSWMSQNQMLSWKVQVGKWSVVHESLPTAIGLAALQESGDGPWVDNYIRETA